MKGFRRFAVIVLVLLVFLPARPLKAEDSVSISGRVTMQGVWALDPNTTKEDPSLIGRVVMDARKSGWRLRSWIEGGWDGLVADPRRDYSLFKNFSEVYQDNTPYLEVKELFVERSIEAVDVRVGVQRFAWGRLDEYPINDLFNPWDYTRFILKPIEDRKIGVPSLSASLNRESLVYRLVWVPWLVPYRLPKAQERWSVVSAGSALVNIPNARVDLQEPDLPARTLENGSVGFRMERMGEIEWAMNFFHGFDPRPVFKTTALRITPSEGRLLIDPGFVPSFHKITSAGMDAAAVRGDWSFRAEAAFAFNRVFNVRQELWGYPPIPVLGLTPLKPIEIERNSLDYGLAVDYRLFEDGLLTLQAQQTWIMDRPASLYEREIETLCWANLRVGWMNQKIETSLNLAYNPEHGASMVKPSATYIFSDSWKLGIMAVLLDGPPQSIFGRYARNDQIEMALVYSW